MATFILGTVLTVAFWVAAWTRVPIASEYSFFPLWLGYVLSVNGISELAYHDSLLKRMRGRFAHLFIASIPLWWFFEWANSCLQNWHYILLHPISELHYVIQASVDFSTVVPAVLSTAFLFHRFFANKKKKNTKPITIRSSWLVWSVIIGGVSFCFMPLFPNQTFPLIWIAPFLIIEPILYAGGMPSLLRQIEKGSWALTCSIMIGTLFTGFFWESWNFYSLPKWYYTIPYVGFWKVFEMPILGYGGYPFFGLVVFSYTTLVFAVVLRKNVLDMYSLSR
jgi:hypothetical protein